MKILVTGGGGFLGSAIVNLLISERNDDVVSVARSDYPHLRDLGCHTVRGDLADPAVAVEAVKGCKAVIHTAAKAGVWGDPAEYVAANLTATQNLLAASKDEGVAYFIHTSTPSVTFDGTDVENGGEDLPYPSQFVSHYARTKAEAEKLVLGEAADDFLVTALRPHLIYGPGDPHLLPRVIDRHRSGQLKKVGDGKNRVDVTYVDNAAWAHVDALESFEDKSLAANGRAFFVSDDHPVALWEFIDQIVTTLGYPKIPGQVPQAVARTAGAMLEAFHKTFRPNVEPRMTRFVADQLATSHWYDMVPLKEAIGFYPRVNPEVAMEKTLDDLRARGFAYSTRPS